MSCESAERGHLFARVVDVSPNRIYLEVERQIRFRANYEQILSGHLPAANDLIEFHFAWASGRPCVAIDAIISGSSLTGGSLQTPR